MSKLNDFAQTLGLSSSYDYANNILTIKSAGGTALRTVAIKSLDHGQRLTAQAMARPLDFVKWLGFDVDVLVHVDDNYGWYDFVVTSVSASETGAELRGVAVRGTRTERGLGRTRTTDLANTVVRTTCTKQEYKTRSVSNVFC